MRKILYYLPRALTIIIAAFLYLFVAEAFTPEFGWRAGLSHFILATVVLIFGIVAWKKPLVGGWLLFLPLLVSFVTSRGGLNPVFAAIAFVGLLYLVEGYTKKKR
jgi:hypothetical protein